MGSCMSSASRSNSKMELSDLNSNIYRVVNVDDNGHALWNGQLGITRTELTLYRKGKDPTRWPLKCLRRYGYDADLFSFEAGRRCVTGEGIYAFRCRRAENLFQTMQSYIQMSSLSDDGTGTLLANSTAIRNSDISSPLPLPTNNNIGSYILPNSRSSNPNTLRMSPSVDADDINRGFNAPTDSIYLEPLTTPTENRMLTRFHSLGDATVSSMLEPISPGSPNSINNILEVTTLNPLPNNGLNNNGVSNIYQEFPLRTDNANYRDTAAKKLSLDVPPQEHAPSANFTTQIDAATALRSQIASNANSINGNNSTVSIENLPMSLPISPTQSTNDSSDTMPTYVNVTPGEISSSASTPKFSLNEFKQSLAFRNSNANNNNYIVDSTHCYENLEPSEMRQNLIRNQQQRRQSRTDLLSKNETTVSTSTDKNSEPTTPTNHKVNYIVLDLDQTHTQPMTTASTPNGTPLSMSTSINTIATSDILPSTSSVNSSPTKVASISNTAAIITNATIATSISTSTTAHSISSLLPPESPKKGIFDYATIDFNKTVALSNSITPTVDCEGSRKTRHNSTAVPIIANVNPVITSLNSSTNANVPPSHSNSISD